MFDKLSDLEKRYESLSVRLSEPDVIADPQELEKVARAHAELAPTVEAYREFRRVQEENRGHRSDAGRTTGAGFSGDGQGGTAHTAGPRPTNCVTNFVARCYRGIPTTTKTLSLKFEPALAAMRQRCSLQIYFVCTRADAEERRWRVEMLSASGTELGGFKEVIFMIHGHGVYSRLKYESGVHRVQRIPETEASGRIHTSTATVAVLPEAEEVDLEIRPDELRIDVFRSGGKGGQSVNTTDSAIRITHLPTGLVVSCQDERSQLQNREKAMRVLRARLLDMKQKEQEEEVAAARRSQVGTGDRSERIRTYNFPQGRVTDHRIGLTLYRLDAVLDGDLDEAIDALIAAEQAERLAHVEAGG